MNFDYFFLNETDFAHFMACSVLCATYFMASCVGILSLLKQKLPSIQTVLYTNVYSLVLSTPLMPFIYAQSMMHHSNITIISLFALSNVIWQILYLTAIHNFSPRSIIVPISLSNICAWAIMSLTNYWFYEKLIHMFI